MVIPKRFQEQVNAHLLGNFLQIRDYPLILSIMGKPGFGKTYQLRSHLTSLGITIFSISSADLESERAGVPAKLLKTRYVDASVEVSKKRPAALVIDDIDTTVGEWEKNTGTVNHQGILAFLMHIADRPDYIEDIGPINRIPVFLTGNNFNLLYEPLRRPGRMLRFDWEPTQEEKIDIVTEIFSFPNKNISKSLVDAYPTESIAFFSSLFATQKLTLLAQMSSNAMFKYILENPVYRDQLYQKYTKALNNTDWIKILRPTTLEA